MSENRMYDEMFKAARERLRGKDAYKLSENSAVDFDGERFSFACLGRPVSITYPQYDVFSPFERWLSIVALHYLDIADATPLSDSFISFSQHRDGLVRGGGFDALVERKCAQSLGNLTQAELVSRCKGLGAKLIDANSDICAVFQVFPRYPIVFKLWLADDDFPASGRFFLNASAEHYLTIEDAVTVGEVLLSLLEK